jgi:hypothetical protein
MTRIEEDDVMEQQKTLPPPTTAPDPNAVDKSIGGITASVNALTESFTKTYERLTYAGFVSVFGAILVFVPLVLGKTPFISATIEEQRLYVLSGVIFVLVGASWMTIQNLLIYKLQRAKQEVACRMLAIRVAAMGDTQAAALKAIGEAQGADLNDNPFNVK